MRDRCGIFMYLALEDEEREREGEKKIISRADFREAREKSRSGTKRRAHIRTHVCARDRKMKLSGIRSGLRAR